MAETLTDIRGALLLGWASASGRDLPWRRTRDPWAILVSETMLQQTQVTRVVPKFETFMERFPDVETCAAAPLGDVIDLWSGLGYNRRAVNLHRAANVFVDQHDGSIPADLHLLRAVPGIGDYTARAVLAFAFEADAGVLDTNAARVIARWEGRCLRRAEAQHIADALVPSGQAWSWNQAMLDLGATICRPRGPDCESCPVARACAWRMAGRPDPDPAIGSAGVSTRQSRFEGSDRQGRGRLVAALRTQGLIEKGSLAGAAGWHHDHDRAHRVAESLVRDGLATWADDGLRLPG